MNVLLYRYRSEGIICREMVDTELQLMGGFVVLKLLDDLIHSLD